MSEVLIGSFSVIEEELVDVLLLEDFEGFLVTVDDDFLQSVQKKVLVSLLFVDQFKNHRQVVIDVTLNNQSNISNYLPRQYHQEQLKHYTWCLHR